MIQKIQIDGVRYEVDYYVTGSTVSFGESVLEIENIVNLSTNQSVDYDVWPDLITPEREERLVAHYLDNYDPSE